LPRDARPCSIARATYAPWRALQKVVIVAGLKARVGKKVGKIPAQVVADLL
jgi:hypothetical protein